MKRVIIVHGWSGSPKRDWIPWLTNKLLEKGYAVEALKMPGTYIPLKSLWMPYLRNKVGTIDNETYFVGYSLGTRALLLLLSKEEHRAGGILFVGGFAGGRSFVTFPYGAIIETAARGIILPWLNAKVDYQKIKSVQPKITVILSDNDHLVPFEKNAQAFKEKLDAKIVTVSGKGHFMHEEIGPSLPEILEETLKILQ